MKKTYGAFTLTELLVAITILSILGTIGFYSYTQNLTTARDSTRKTNLATLESQLTLYKKQRGLFPSPIHNKGDYVFGLENQEKVVAFQGKMDDQIALSTADSIPTDPSNDGYYAYSVTHNNQEFQLAATLENSGNPQAYIVGNYSSVARTVLPTLFIATTGEVGDMNINDPPYAKREIGTGSTLRSAFIFHENIYNLPYGIDSGLPVLGESDFDTLLDEAILRGYRQKNDFRSCEEIYKAAKIITPADGQDEYQIRDNVGKIKNVTCSCTSTGCVNQE